jgi:hypothetical protein
MTAQKSISIFQHSINTPRRHSDEGRNPFILSANKLASVFLERQYWYITNRLQLLHGTMDSDLRRMTAEGRRMAARGAMIAQKKMA